MEDLQNKWDKIEQLIKLSEEPLADENCQNYNRFLYHLLLQRKPKVALEIGTGKSSAYMAKAACQYDGFIVGIDLYPSKYRPRENYYFVQGDSNSATVWNKVLSFCQQIGKIGLVYQDTDLPYEESLREWKMYSQLLAKDAIWICGNVTYSFFNPQTTLKYFESLPGDKRLYPNVLHTENTQGIVLL